MFSLFMGMSNSSNMGMDGSKSTIEMRKILRRMKEKLEGMMQVIQYLSLYMEKQESNQEEIEDEMHEQSMKFD